MSLIEATARLAGTGATRLHPNYIWATLKDRDQDPAITAAFEQALAQGTRESRLSLLRVLELKFIHDPKTSGLDILGPELSYHFRDFAWQEDDFPGGPKGPNEQFADVMVDVLDLVRPERRANRSREAVVLREEASEASGITSNAARAGNPNAVASFSFTNQWVSVPGQERSHVRTRAHARISRPQVVAPPRRGIWLVSLPERTVALGIQSAWLSRNLLGWLPRRCAGARYHH